MMSIKIEINNDKSRCTLEFLNGENAIIDGDSDEVNTQHLQSALMYMVRLLRMYKGEEPFDENLQPYQEWMSIVTTEENFNDTKMRNFAFSKEARMAAVKELKNFAQKVKNIFGESYR